MSALLRSVQDTFRSFYTNFDVTQNVDGKILTGLAAVGALYMASYLATPLRAIWRHVLRPRKDLVKRYGGNWALVTGASSGIGEQYCYELAKSGFNIILMSRSQTEMDRVATNIRTNYKVQTKVIPFDLAALSTAEDIKRLYETLDTIQEDVCVLANNAGKAHYKPMHDHDFDATFHMVNLNVNAVIFLSRYFLAKFVKRFDEQGKRSAIINVSSICALGPYPMLSVYAGTKAFDRIFSLSLKKEYGDKVDIHTVLPASTRTQMNSGRYLGSINPDQHAWAVIDQLGWNEKETFGHWEHGLITNLEDFWPSAKLVNFINGRRSRAFQRELEAKRAAQKAAEEKTAESSQQPAQQNQ